jgi:hypothetical protein
VFSPSNDSFFLFSSLENRLQ